MWIDQVRQCLQKKLVYLLRPFETATCARIRTEAFSSHTPCYTDGPISVCDLTCLDFVRIAGVVYPAFSIRDLSTFNYTVRQVLEVMGKCLRLDNSKYQCSLLKRANMIFHVFGLDSKSSVDANAVASKIVDTVTTALDWCKKGIQWISGISQALKSTRHRRSLDEPMVLEIWMFLMNRDAVNSTGLSLNLTETQRNATDEAIEQLAEAVRSMHLLQNIAVGDGQNGSQAMAQARSVTQCFDTQCNTTNPNITNVQPLPDLVRATPGQTTSPGMAGITFGQNSLPDTIKASPSTRPITKRNSPGYPVKDTLSLSVVLFVVLSCMGLF